MPETAKIPNEKVRQLQRQLYVCAKQSRTRRFHALYDRIYRSDVLWEAWRLLMAAGEGSILAGPAGAIALMFNGGEGSSQSQQGCQRITQGQG